MYKSRRQPLRILHIFALHVLDQDCACFAYIIAAPFLCLLNTHPSFSATLPVVMQSPFSYTDSYSSSPGGMDFFYGSTPGYETLCDLDAASPFAMSEVMPEACSFPSSFTSSPYMIPPLSDTGPIYDVSTIATSVPSSASSTCGSSYGGSMSQAEEVPLPTSNNPWRHYDDSCPDSPPQSK